MAKTRISRKGYVLIKMPDHPRAAKGFVMEHVVIAEAALGHALDARHPVHHFNEVKSDNQRRNLVICENNRYHKLLHARMRVLLAGGDPNMSKFCCRCKKLKDRTEFHRSFNEFDGLDGTCKSCDSEKRGFTYTGRRNRYPQTTKSPTGICD